MYNYNNKTIYKTNWNINWTNIKKKMIKQNDTFSSYVTNKKLKHFKTYSTIVY